MSEKKAIRYRLIPAVACLTAVAAFALWLGKETLATTPSQKVPYSDICENPDKLGLSTSDEPLPEMILSAIGIAEGSSILTMTARRAQPSPPTSTEGFIASHYLTVLKLWLTVNQRMLTEFVANCSYFGRDAVGIAEATQVYLAKSVTEISAGETALLAGLLKGPGIYDPGEYPDHARQRRDTILEKMFAGGKITAATMTAAKLEPVTQATVGN